MAARVTHEDSSEWDSSQNNKNESFFKRSDSKEESFDDDRVYGFPNDRNGRTFHISAEEESLQKNDSQGSDVRTKIIPMMVLFE